MPKETTKGKMEKKMKRRGYKMIPKTQKGGSLVLCMCGVYGICMCYPFP